MASVSSEFVRGDLLSITNSFIYGIGNSLLNEENLTWTSQNQRGKIVPCMNGTIDTKISGQNQF